MGLTFDLGGSGGVFGVVGPITTLNGGRLIAEGDSLTEGVYGETVWPDQLDASYASLTVFNEATGGALAADCVTEGASQIDPHYSAGADWNAVVLWAGTNDISDSIAPSTVHGSIQDWCEDRRAAHSDYLIVVLNCARRTDINETDRQTLNSLLASSHSFCDALVDIATALGDWTSHPTYWHSDHVHLTTTGEGIVAAAVESAILGLLP